MRDPAAVEHDVRNEKVSAAAASKLYGAVIGADGLVDDAATAALRVERRRT
jgi:N-methylhydantoinase B/oxoprolinase/acetone carboxylase alpha subunit